MRFIVSMNFNSKLVKGVHVRMKPVFDLLQDIVQFPWNIEVTPTLPNTEHPFVVTVDFFLAGRCCALLQAICIGKLDIISHNSRSFLTNEQKLFTTYREFIIVVFSKGKRDHLWLALINSWRFWMIKNHFLLLYDKSQSIFDFLTAEMKTTNLQNLRDSFTKGDNTSVADALGRSSAE